MGNEIVRASITYLYTIMKYGYPPAIEDVFRALDDISQMGFHYLEMEALGTEHAQAVSNRRSELKRQLDDHDIHVHNFCVVDPDLVSTDDARRREAYERFRRSAELGVELGAETLHLASYAPPVEYVGAKPYQLDEPYDFGDTFRVRIPDGFSWARVWEVLVESCRYCAGVAEGLNRSIIMEPRVGEIICSVDSQVRLIQDVGMGNFKANFDVGHYSAQRENIPLALCKLEGMYANIHASDNDPKNTNHVPPGKGTVDWSEFFRVLKLHKYDGYLGIDIGQSATFEQDLHESVDYLRDAAANHGIVLES